jgi:hypothetical protein
VQCNSENKLQKLIHLYSEETTYALSDWFAWKTIGGIMSTLSQIEKISEKYDISTEDFIRSGAILNLKEKQRLLMIERFEFLARYGATSVEELNLKIAKGTVPEHPGWEDLIELKNIEQELEEIENDIQML